MFPRAHTACSLMWAWGDAKREMNAGIAPPSTTALVCSDVLEVIMLVKAQADSNWMVLQSVLLKKDTNFGIKLAQIMLSIGGCFSLGSSFLMAWVSWSWLSKVTLLFCKYFLHITAKLSFYLCGSFFSTSLANLSFSFVLLHVEVS